MLALLVAVCVHVVAAQTKALPPGHPPIGPAAPSTPTPHGNGSGGEELTWKPPAGWLTEAPSSPMRRGQYKIIGPGGPAECVVFYFGPGQGGEVSVNVARWRSQFRRPDGSATSAEAKTRAITVGDISVTLVEVKGTYVGGMGGGGAVGPPRQDYELLGAIAEGPDAPWFFRAVGPRATLDAQKTAFEEMIRSIRRP